MTDSLTIALAQLNASVGALQDNLDGLRRARADAAAQGVDLLVTPELHLCGYPPEDLVKKPMFFMECRAVAEAYAKETADGGPAVLLGLPWPEDGKLYNAMALIEDGEIKTVRRKVELPNYGVFDEKRVFDAGPMPGPIDFRGVRIGVPICEDIWIPDVVECLEESGAEIILVPNGSPWDIHKHDQRQQIAVQRITESGLPMAYVNRVGGQDELVFDGGSFVLNGDLSVAHHAGSWRQQLVVTQWRQTPDGWRAERGDVAAPEDRLANIYQALVLGLRDYVNRNWFPGVLIGLSGGIDSALSAVVAVDALGPDRVHCVMMPSPYTSGESLEDAGEAAGLLGIQYDTVSIEPAMEAFRQMLQPIFGNRAEDTTEENIQSRSRGMTLMALSNKLGHMVLSTGNKSEMSVGYATLYGDMCGGYNVLKDVYKTTVYELCAWRNSVDIAGLPVGVMGPQGLTTPERIITKAPSAELKPDQKDEDSLPPYPVLDDILEDLIEEEKPLADIVAKGHDRDLVLRIWRMLDIAEYKRRQAPPGVKITGRAFGRERRYPITNGFRAT
ncbi:MAG: NAD+ synthase [Alphaproteobacteria bacterium]|nr:NAD+ synthase [Alphaproteobacteria bacterium]